MSHRMSTTCTEFGITLAISSTACFPAPGNIFKCEVMVVEGALGLVLVPHKLAWFCFLHSPGDPQLQRLICPHFKFVANTQSDLLQSPVPQHHESCATTPAPDVRALLPPLSMLNLSLPPAASITPFQCGECRCTHLCTSQHWFTTLGVSPSLRLV